MNDDGIMPPFVERDPVDSGLGFFDEAGRWVKVVLVPVARADTAEEDTNACEF